MCKRHFTAISILVAAVATANAGQIQLGGANGLSSTYITTQCMTNGGPNADGCVTSGGATVKGTATTPQNFLNGLFNGAIGVTNPAPPDQGTIQDKNANTGGSVASPVTFDLMNNGSTASGDNNVWLVAGTTGGASGTNANLTIPVGLYNVDSVWTVLNDYWSIVGQSMVTVTFNFANDQAGTSGLNSVAVALTGGTNIRSAVDCTAGTGATSGNGSCPSQYAAGSGLIAATLTSGTTSPTTGVSVSASNIFTSAYSNAITQPYKNTSGNVVLDDQEFVFSPSVYQNEYLVSNNVNDVGTSGVSRAALAAVTVDSTSSNAGVLTQSVVPEPASLLLAGVALGAAGLIGRRGGKRESS